MARDFVIQGGMEGGANAFASSYAGDSNYTSGSGAGMVNFIATPSFNFAPTSPTVAVNVPLSLTTTVVSVIFKAGDSVNVPTATGAITTFKRDLQLGVCSTEQRDGQLYDSGQLACHGNRHSDRRLYRRHKLQVRQRFRDRHRDCSSIAGPQRFRNRGDRCLRSDHEQYFNNHTDSQRRIYRQCSVDRGHHQQPDGRRRSSNVEFWFDEPGKHFRCHGRDSHADHLYNRGDECGSASAAGAQKTGLARWRRVAGLHRAVWFHCTPTSLADYAVSLRFPDRPQWWRSQLRRGRVRRRWWRRRQWQPRHNGWNLHGDGDWNVGRDNRDRCGVSHGPIIRNLFEQPRPPGVRRRGIYP